MAKDAAPCRHLTWDRLVSLLMVFLTGAAVGAAVGVAVGAADVAAGRRKTAAGFFITAADLSPSSSHSEPWSFQWSPRYNHHRCYYFYCYIALPLYRYSPTTTTTTAHNVKANP